MEVSEILAVIEAGEADYRDIGNELIKRLAALGVTDGVVALSCIHSRNTFVLYDMDFSSEVMKTSDPAWEPLFGNVSADPQRIVFSIDLSILDELQSFSPVVFVSGQFADIDRDLSQGDIETVLRNFCLAAVRRHRAMIRRAFIEARVGSADLGTFCYRLLHERLPPLLPAEAASIFVLDKLTDELRLRGQAPPRTDSRHLSDIVVGRNSKSWVERAFQDDAPIAEYDASGHLRVGATAERVALQYYSRLYWPVRLQFRASGTTQNRMKDPVIGVVRVSNISDSLGGWPRPFHCFDAFAVEFVAESLYNLISPFVDRAVEGFNRDLAFHGAKTPAAGCVRNLKLAASFLFKPTELAFLQAKPSAITTQFNLTQIGRFDKHELIQAFNNAYAFAINISAQIERANITEEYYAEPGHRVDSLFADVIQKSINLAPYFAISHSVGPRGATSIPIINRIFDLELPPPVIGEEGALTSVFNNLIENSIKYGPPDETPKVNISWKNERDYVCVSVRDNGIGVPDSDSERIFTSGVRSERARQHTVRGDGLGLAYCKRVLRAFGGSIKAVPLKDGLEIQVRLRKATS